MGMSIVAGLPYALALNPNIVYLGLLTSTMFSSLLFGGSANIRFVLRGHLPELLQIVEEGNPPVDVNCSNTAGS